MTRGWVQPTDEPKRDTDAARFEGLTREQQFKMRSEEDSAPAGDADELPLSIVAEWPSLSTIEGRYVEKVLAHTGGNKKAAARVLEVDRKTLDRMIKRHQLSVERIAKFPRNLPG